MFLVINFTKIIGILLEIILGDRKWANFRVKFDSQRTSLVIQ
jgi:hypothetical protein